MSRSLSAFPYIGGKNHLADWIINYLPEHEAYVEVFGGAANVLLNKSRSRTEVYNDLNGDLVHFFETARERPGELEEWLRMVPYSRELHDEWSREYYQENHRPEDEIERAGRFFFLRFSQFASKIHTRSGFRAGRQTNNASAYSSGRDRIEAVAKRLENVIIENLHWADLLELYDGPDTVLYFDPPYVDTEGYYGAFDFDHGDLMEALADLEGRWLLSYEKLPDELRASDYWITERDVGWSARANRYDGRKEATERLVLNFDPETTPKFSGAGQSTLAFGEGGRSE